MAGEGVLVTGAGGFIGGRVVEVLHALGRPRVRAGVRRWSSGARIGRFPVEIVACDVTDPAQLARALEGVRGVVHCAVGDRDVVARGTENVLAAAHDAGVDRVVHLSTVDVYGEASGEVDESAPLTKTGRPYGDAKIEAEEICRRWIERGLPVVLLRPSLVYGPFSAAWTIEWAQRLQARPWMLADADCQGTCNLVYVDDLVGAVLRALDRPDAVGEAFNVNGPDRPSWAEYFHVLNAALALPPLRSQSAAASHLSARAMAPVRATAKWMMARFDAPIMALYQRSDLAKKWMKIAEGMIRKTPTSAEFGLLGRRVSFATGKLEQRLGWRPRFPLADGVALSAAWLRHHGYVPDGDVSRETS
jgi:nucleoside-diphosphate-sugar epimerase